MCVILIGIDDTDNPTSRGTGHLARELSTECARRNLQPLGVTRHQFLLDPRIPYTSHNSGACIAVTSPEGIGVVDFAFDFVRERSAAGSDPGVCISVVADVTTAIEDFGCLVAQRVLTIDEALRVGVSPGVKLRALGVAPAHSAEPPSGRGQGVIGALGSVGQRRAGEDGRFIELPGLRTLHGRVDRQAFADLGISLAHEPSRHRLAPDDRYETFDWVRPRLMHGKPVFPVEWSEGDHVWLPVDRKRSRPHE